VAVYTIFSGADNDDLAYTGRRTTKSSTNIYFVTYMNGNIAYLSYSDDDGATWTQEVVSNTNFFLACPVCCVDSSDTVHVFYAKLVGGSLHIHYRSRDSGGSWSAETQLTSGATQCYYPDCGVDSSDVVYVAYLKGTGARVRDSSDNFASESVEIGSSLDIGPSFAIDSSDNLYCCYTYDTGDAVFLWYKPSGGSWTSGGNMLTVGTYDYTIDCVTESDTLHVIAYRNGDKCYHNSYVIGSGSSGVTGIDSSSKHPTISIGGDGIIHVLTYLLSGLSPRILHNYYSGGAWHFEVLIIRSTPPATQFYFPKLLWQAHPSWVKPSVGMFAAWIGSATATQEIECYVSGDYSPGGGTAHMKSLSDIIAVSDLMTRIIGKNVNDSIAIFDAITSRSIGKGLNDTVDIFDLLVKQMGIELSDSISISDVIDRMRDIYMYFSLETGGLDFTMTIQFSN